MLTLNKTKSIGLPNLKKKHVVLFIKESFNTFLEIYPIPIVSSTEKSGNEKWQHISEIMKNTETYIVVTFWHIIF